MPHEGIYYPIMDENDLHKFLKIKQSNMPRVFGHVALFLDGGRVFGSIRPTKEQLVEAQRLLEIVRLEEAEQEATKEWLEAKIAAARAKLKALHGIN